MVFLMKKYLHFIMGIIFGVVMVIASRQIYKRYKSPIQHLAIKLLKREEAFLEKDKNNPHHTLISAADAYKEFQTSPNKPTLRVKTINFDPSVKPENVRVQIIHEVLAEKYNLTYDDENYDILLNSFFDNESVPSVSPNIVRIYYTGEVYAGDPNLYLDTNDLVTGFAFIDHPNYVRVPFSYLRDTDKMRHDYQRPGTCDPSKKPYFACFVVSNFGSWLPGRFDGVDARDRMFHQLSLYKKVMSGGLHLNNMGGVVPYAETKKFMSQCKFIIAYENIISYPGNVTEKPFQAWFSGGVPLYNTHKDGMVDLNPKSLLYAGDFATEEEFIEYIKKVDNDDELYCKIWNEHIITDPSKDYSSMKDKLRQKLYEAIEKKVKK
jgi:hypothetical protein